MVTISVLLMVFFTFAASIKLFGWQEMIFQTQLKFFVKYGLNRAAMLAVGVIELLASLALATALLTGQSIWQSVGAMAILLTSLGAIYFHLRFDGFKDAIPAIVTMSLSMALLVLNRAVIIALI